LFVRLNPVCKLHTKPEDRGKHIRQKLEGGRNKERPLQGYQRATEKAKQQSHQPLFTRI
jgi:hypothetical protein